MAGRLLEDISKAIEEVREKKPLIHHITNYVTVNDCANVVLAIGASPIMADDIEEVQDITAISSALVINIGTLNSRTIESMLAAGRKANEMNIPVVLDPVGAGASKLRNETTQRLLREIKFSVIRGNISEIKFIAGIKASTKGVDASESDSLDGETASKVIAEKVSRRFECVTAITGVIDVVSDGTRTILLKNGTKLLSKVTGTGCMCSSLIGSFCGASSDKLIAAAAGILSMSIAGEIAEESFDGNGSYRVKIIDEISRLNSETFMKRGKVHEA